MWLKVIGALLGTLGLVGVGFLHQLEQPQISEASRANYSVSTKALPLEIYCPGPVAELGGKDGTDLGSMALTGAAEISSHVSAGEIATEIPTLIESGALLGLASNEQTTQALSANQWQILSRPRMAGLAANNCDQPQSSGWFATGMGSVGSESVLHLANPTSNEVQVMLVSHLPTSTKEQLVTLAAFEQVQISLASLADAEPSFALHFYSNGPGVSAVLQNRLSSGLATAGVEMVAASSPTANWFIPGLVITAESYQAPRLRLVNTSDSANSLLVTFHGSGVDSDVLKVDLGPHEIVEEVLNLAPGSYLIEVSGQEQSTGAIWVSQLADAVDFAWLVPAAQFESALTIPLPKLSGDLVIANPNNEPINVSVMMAGQYQSHTIGRKGQIILPSAGSLAVVQSDGLFMASLLLSEDRGIAVIAPKENANLGSDLVIAVD